MTSNMLETIFLLTILIAPIQCSHFLGGSITWRIFNVSNSGTSVTIIITQNYQVVYAAGRCDSGSFANQIVVPSLTGSLACSPSCPSGFGTISVSPYCTDVSVSNGIASGQRLDTVTIPVNSDFYVYYASTAWYSGVTGASGWSVSSRINLVRRSDNNQFNNAPVANVISPLNIQINQITNIPLSISDADGDVIRCRWANASGVVNECGSVCSPSNLPPNTILYSNCTIEITGLVNGAMYAISFMTEDFINSTSTSPLSSVPVQFVVKVVTPSVCSTAPEIALSGSTIQTVHVNETFTAPLYAINHCGTSATIVDITTISFSGLLQTSLTQISTALYYKTLTWTPTLNQIGYQIMCASALDSQSLQSTQTCLTFFVIENNTITTTTTAISTTTTAISTTSSTTSTAANEVTTTQTPESSNVNWSIIGSVIALVFLLAIISSSYIIYRYLKFNRYKHQPKPQNKNSATNSPSLSSHRSTDSPISPISEKTMNNNDVEDEFEPKILYPSTDATQAKHVSLPIERILMESQLSQISTIELNDPTPYPKQLTDIPKTQIETIELNDPTPHPKQLTHIPKTPIVLLKTKSMAEKPRSIHAKIRKSFK